MKIISPLVVASQLIISLIALIWAVGLTVIVNDWVGPALLFPPFSKVGVTTMVATCAEVVTLVATKLAIVPLPDDERPIDELSFVQE